MSIRACVWVFVGSACLGIAFAREHPFEDNVNLFDLGIETLPDGSTKICETEEEVWWYVQEWHDLRALSKKRLEETRTRLTAGKVSQDAKSYREEIAERFSGLFPYRRYCPIIVHDKRDQKWRALGLCRVAHTICPVQQDPFNPDLIWVGCNDGPPGLHADYFYVAPGVWFGAPLEWGAKRGGLAIVNIRERWVCYYGPYLHLVDSRVYEILFEKDFVWVWGRYPAGGQLDGLSMYNRSRHQMSPILLERQIGVEGWQRAKLTSTDKHVEVKAWQHDGHIVRWRLDKRTQKWEMPSYVWVAREQVVLRKEPQEAAESIGILKRGNALAVFERKRDWLCVATGEDALGWLKKDDVLETMAYFAENLETYVATPDYGNGGPRSFLWRAYLYMTDAQVAEAAGLMQKATDVAGKEAKDMLTSLIPTYTDGLERGRQAKKVFDNKADTIRP